MSHHHSPLNATRWRATRRAIFERDGWRCVACGHAGRLECDHVIPLHGGGDPWAMDNLQSLCRACHIEKTSFENERPAPGRDAWRRLVALTMDDFVDDVLSRKTGN